MFVPGDPLKNKPGDFVREVDCLESHRQNYSNGYQQLEDYSLFFIRLAWALSSPEITEWNRQWGARPGREDEKRRLDEDLANFIALAPSKVVSSVMNQPGQYQQTLEEGFRLLHQVVDIERELGLLAQQP